MNIKESIKILGQAAGELSVLINCYNARLKKQISATDLDEPEYMDMQTCHELQVIAKEMESLPQWISVEDRLPEENGKYLIHTASRQTYTRQYYTHHINRFFGNVNATHWMPLPAPPNKQD